MKNIATIPAIQITTSALILLIIERIFRDDFAQYAVSKSRHIVAGIYQPGGGLPVDQRLNLFLQ